MRLLFFGTGEIGVPTLRWLLRESGHDVVGVVTQPDKPVGRSRRLTPPAPKPLAIDAGVPVWQPEDIREAAAELVALDPDVSVVVAYGQFIPARLRDGVRLACINLHASLLPRWRGASPVQSAIAAGDAVTGVTVMFVAREMDAGDILLAETTPILPADTGQSLHDRLARIAPKALDRALVELEAGTARRTPQDPASVTHCAKLTREHGRIDWSRPAVEIERVVRAFDPWPGTHTALPDGRALKIFPRVSVGPAAAAGPGTIVEAGPGALVVAAGAGTIGLGDVQVEGQRRLALSEFARGSRLRVGDRLG
jgi:methionyl-tRNA formyltransferase